MLISVQASFDREGDCGLSLFLIYFLFILLKKRGGGDADGAPTTKGQGGK